MREPYETLLGPYRDSQHWLLWPFLDGEVPDFAGIQGSEPLGKLSSGEMTLVNVALAIWNGDRTARISDLGALDYKHRSRVIKALDIASMLMPR